MHELKKQQTSQETRFEFESFIHVKHQKKNKIDNLTGVILVNVYIWMPCYFLNNILKTHQIHNPPPQKKTHYESNSTTDYEIILSEVY